LDFSPCAPAARRASADGGRINLLLKERNYASPPQVDIISRTGQRAREDKTQELSSARKST